MTTETDRQSIISRCKKFAAMTTERGAGEAEAKIAASKLAALMSEYNITRTELEIRADASNCIRESYNELRSTRSDWTSVSLPISKLFSCKVWLEESFEDILEIGEPMTIQKIMYFGLETDVFASLAMTSIVHTAIINETDRFKGKGRLAKSSFRAGIIEGLSTRIRELIATVPQASGKGLIVLKDQLVTDAFAKLNLRLRTVSARHRKIDSGAYASGKSAASGVDLGFGKKVSSNTKAIGSRK